MKPAPFEYFAPESVQEALSLLEQYGEDAKILAGGISLGPQLNMRNISPEVIIDINRLDELSYVRRQDDHLEIGALARQRALERSTLIEQGWSLLSEAAPHIAHPTLRNRGTICGSIAWAYPAAELPAITLALDAELRLLGPGGERRVHPKDFFLSYMTTDLEPDELLVEARFPPAQPRTGHAWLEVARRHGDYALVGVGVVLTLREDGLCETARLAYTGVEEVPYGAQEAAKLLVGEEPTDDSFAAAAEQAAADSEPGSDAHASAGYRRHLIRVLTRRALEKALEQAKGAGDGA